MWDIVRFQKVWGPDDLTTMKYTQQVVLHCCTRSAFYRLQFSNWKRQKPQLSSTWPRWELCVEPLLGFIVQWSGCTTCPSNREWWLSILFDLNFYGSKTLDILLTFEQLNHQIDTSSWPIQDLPICARWMSLIHGLCPEDVGWHAPGSGAALCSGREGATTSSFQRSMAGFR